MARSEERYQLTCRCGVFFFGDTENDGWGKWRKHYEDTLVEDDIHVVVQVRMPNVVNGSMPFAHGVEAESWKDLVKWMAQTVHETHHGGQNWKECVMSTCSVAQQALGVGVGASTGIE